ncbi:Pentatricopeptide repeat-containing protein [Striga hermonthica]|uniref:Pentatricopeptide repeat-containing protein n=1 Tax=Striga hermonthica TaxID=68872 RepID=A0A9N7NIN7_STRHE|nr:Pentatricopeptide repeat-containing protein [Striga hermonthica]
MNATHQEETLISLIKSCSHKSHLLQLHCLLIRTSLLHSPAVFCPFLSRLALPPFRAVSYAGRIFRGFPSPGVFLYNTIIRAHSLSPNTAHDGLRLYRELLSSNIPSNSLSAAGAVKCCAHINSLRGGAQIHARICKDGFSSDGRLMTTLMDLYSSLQEGSSAYKVFEEMRHRDTVAWNVLISCCTRNGRTRDALTLFERMISNSSCPPDDVTCLLVLRACANLNVLDWGEKVHRYISENGLSHAKNVSNSLISMYSRCGSMEKAYEVFQHMPDRDVVTWSALISGLASNGYGPEAIRAFHQMCAEGISPDDQTFTGLLSACSHSGLVETGRAFFKSMSRDYGVQPSIHHYGCMVDLLGRAGLLDEAYELVNSMEIKPDPTMWRTLLGACRIHRHAALGERVVERLVELKAQEAGDYILLLNIYSSSGESEKVMEIRKMMKEKSIRTTPASSSVELKGQVHEFFADDVLHPSKKAIYGKLDEINQQLRIAGYVAEIEPGREVLYHSEKLAIAFVILETPPGTTVRVAKDLRICADCHNFCKILSAVYDRKVVVRDRNRFHHFREGRCSCNDYW